MTVDCFEVWETYPGGKILVEEEYRKRERQIGVRQKQNDGRKVWWRER